MRIRGFRLSLLAVAAVLASGLLNLTESTGMKAGGKPRITE